MDFIVMFSYFIYPQYNNNKKKSPQKINKNQELKKTM
jgi:hypothetical protein